MTTKKMFTKLGYTVTNKEGFNANIHVCGFENNSVILFQTESGGKQNKRKIKFEDGKFYFNLKGEKLYFKV